MASDSQRAAELHTTSQMSLWEVSKKNFVYKTECFNYLVIRVRFIDDSDVPQ